LGKRGRFSKVSAALRRGMQNSENAGLDRKMPFLDGHYRHYLAAFSTTS
jgi:hypothetical protein